MVRDSRHNLLTGGPSSREKHLNKFFKICNTGFWRLDLVTCSQLIPVAKNVCFALWGLFLGQFSKTLHFSLAYYDYSLSCPFLSLTNSPCSLQKNPPFSSSFLHKSSRKGTGSIFFSMYFTFLALDFLDCMFVLKSENMMFKYGLLMFSWAWCLVFVSYMVLHFALGYTWCHLLHTHTLWYD